MGKRHEIDPRAEFQRAEFGDRRLNERLLTMFDAVVDAPSRSFPSAMPSDAQLEGTYRFFKNEKVTLDRLIAPHIEATVGRAAADGSLLVLHDTTEFRFGGASRREGLGGDRERWPRLLRTLRASRFRRRETNAAGVGGAADVHQRPGDEADPRSRLPQAEARTARIGAVGPAIR